MKVQAILGIILIVLGVVALIHKGITYTTRERVIDVGPVKADVDEKHTIPIEPIVGGLLLASGVVLIVAGNRTT